MTRDEILTAAAQIFSQKGFHAASMQEKASLYHHVSSKQEILLALLDRALDLLIEHIEGVTSKLLAPGEKLRQAMQAYLQAMLDHREMAAVLLLEHRSLEPELHARHTIRRDRFERLWRDLIQEGVEAGVFYSPDPALAGRALLGAMNWTITWFRPEGKLNPQEIAEGYANQFLQGLLVRGD